MSTTTTTISFLTLILLLSTLATQSSALPAAPLRRRDPVLREQPAINQPPTWQAVGQAFFLPGQAGQSGPAVLPTTTTTSSSSVTSPTPTPTPTLLPRAGSPLEKRAGNIYRLAPASQSIALSLLSEYLLTATGSASALFTTETQLVNGRVWRISPEEQSVVEDLLDGYESSTAAVVGEATGTSTVALGQEGTTLVEYTTTIVNEVTDGGMGEPTPVTVTEVLTSTSTFVSEPTTTGTGTGGEGGLTTITTTFVSEMTDGGMGEPSQTTVTATETEGVDSTGGVFTTLSSSLDVVTPTAKGTETDSTTTTTTKTSTKKTTTTSTSTKKTMTTSTSTKKTTTTATTTKTATSTTTKKATTTSTSKKITATTTTKATTTSTKKTTTTTTKKSTTTTKASSTTTKKTTTTTKAAATSTSTGASYTLPTSVTTVAGLLTSMKQIGSWAFGSQNAAFVSQVPASAYTSGKTDGTNNEPALRALYPAGSYSPGNTPQGGIGFYAAPVDITSSTNLSFSYSVFFPTGFNFVKGGKLPGLYGGKKGCSGGDAATNCFSTRIMFRTGGMGEMYLYAPREKQVEALCTLPPLSFCNSVYGMSIGRGSWTFATGVWTNVRQDVWLNTPGVADGGFNIWVNGELKLSSSQVYYRNTAAGNTANGTAPEPITLIDYDSLPSDIIIPNGGFNTTPVVNTTGTTTTATATETSFSLSLNTKIVGTSTVVSTETVTPTPYDFDNRRRMLKKRNVVELALEKKSRAEEGSPQMDLEKQRWRRATSLLPTMFSGIMFDTFFGGSSVDYATPKTVYTYFNKIGLKINS